MLLKASKFFLYASLFSVLVVITSTFFPFIGGKYYFYRTATELALLCFVVWWGFQAKPGEAKELFLRVTKQPLFIAVSAFVAAFMLATLFANDVHAAFWSNFERGDGGFQMVHYYISFVLMLMFFEKHEDWERLFKVSLLAAVGMILYGVIGQFGTVAGFISPYGGNIPTTVWGKLTEARFQGSLGNPAYVAPYLMFSMFYALYVWFSPSRWNWFRKPWLRHIFYGGLTLAFLFFFALSQTRGAFVGLVAAGAVFFGYLLFSWPRGRRWVLLTVAGGILVLGILFSYRDTPFVQHLPGGRFFSVSLSDQTIQTRAWTWNSAWQGFKERPLFGWGPENFTAVFDKYFDPRHYIPGTNSETWFDRAHSVIFDYLAETGIVGLLAYLGMFIVFYRELFRNIIQGGRGGGGAEKSAPNRFQQALLISLPAGYFVQGLALFDVLPIYINLFLFLAFATYLFSKGRAKHESNIL